MKKVFLFPFIGAGIILFSLACNTVINQKSKHQFYYYPDKNVYYDVDKNSFLYSIDGAKTWSSIASNVQKPPALLGEGITIYSDSTDVYKDNETHRKLYIGVLYNLLQNDTTASVTQPEVSERKVVPTSKPAAVVTQDVKPKKGLGKFLSKIFGRKDKK